MGYQMSLGQKMTALRLNRRASLQEVADAVGVSKAHIWQLEKGKTDNPAIGLVARLADYFGVSVGYMIGEQIDAPDADIQLSSLFRQAQQLDDRERQILGDMMQSLLKQKNPGG